MSGVTERLGRLHPGWRIAAWWIAGVAIVNPFREMALLDDWSYSRMVRDFLRAGTHRADDWVAANPLAQVEWGALFSTLFGYSHSSLRISTLVLAAVALLSFFLLSRDHGLGRAEAAALTLVLASSPLFFRLSFSFMTDVPFLAGFLLSSLLYGKALRLESPAIAALASVAGAATILTRQFGAVLLPAIVLVWMRGARRQRNPLVPVFALVLPSLASAYQFWLGAFAPNWTASRLAFDQRQHMASLRLLGELLWRPGVTFVYLGLFALPISLPLLRKLIADQRALRRQDATSESRPTRRPESLACLALIATLAVGAIGFGRPWRLPLLPWNLDAIEHGPKSISLTLTLVAIATGAMLAGSFWRRYSDSLLRPASAAEWLLDATAAWYLLSQLLFVQFGDEYLLPLLPFALIVVGRDLWTARPVGERDLRQTRLLALGLFLVLAFHFRGQLSRAEAQWRGGDLALQLGAAPDSVSASWEWDCYNGSFDRFVASRVPGPSSRSLDASLRDFFVNWLPEENRHAIYFSAPVYAAPKEASSLHVLATIPYRDGLLRPRAVSVLTRPPFELKGCTGGLAGEGDAGGWWRWTADRIDCNFEVRPRLPTSAVVAFDYWTPAMPREVELTIGARAIRVHLPVTEMRAYRSGLVRVDQSPLQISIRLADGSPARRLSERDPRLAAFLVKNLRLEIPSRR